VTTTDLARNPVAETLARVHLAPRQTHKALTVWPLLADTTVPASGLAYRTLADALEAGDLLVDEVSEGGFVPNVRVTNRGREAVLVLFGEEIVGAKQNRVANASFLVGAESSVVIDVSCVEQGRWGRRAGVGFLSSDHLISHMLRRKMQAKVAMARAVGQSFDADQAEVWDEVRHRVVSSQTSSRSIAYDDYHDSRRTDLEEILAAFRALPGQVGFVAAIGDAMHGVEFLGRPDVFARCFERMLRAYAIDAVDAGLLRSERPVRPGRRARPDLFGEPGHPEHDDLLEGPASPAAPPAPAFDSPEAFLAALAAAEITRCPSLGLGEDLRLRGPRVAGCALAVEGVVHLMGHPVGS
jgi:hypothetical protein